MNKYKRGRWHKVKMWFYWLTLNDIIKGFRAVGSTLFLLLTIAMMFGMVFIVPHLFH